MNTCLNSLCHWLDLIQNKFQVNNFSVFFGYESNSADIELKECNEEDLTMAESIKMVKR